MAIATAQLWDAWRTRADEAAFEKLVRPELPATFHLAQRLGLGRADAEDVVQDALLRLAQERSDTPGKVGVGAWLMRTVRFQSLTRRRSTRRRRKHERSEAIGRSMPGGAGPDVREEVERALAQLEAPDRQILMFRFLYDLDYREIAYVLGISENACRIRVHRASERMRTHLGSKAPTLLAALSLPAFPKTAHCIAVATKGTATTAVGAGLLGGLLMSAGMKMAAAAAASALLTAGAFVALRDEPPVPEPLAQTVQVEREQRGPAAPKGGGAGAEPTLMTVPRREETAALRGTGVISGRVATKDGTGVPSLVVIAVPLPKVAPATPWGEAPPASSVEEEVRRGAASARRRATGRRRVTTAADGTYTVTGLADVDYRIHAYGGKGYEIRVQRDHNAWNVKPGATVDFVATFVVALRVSVEGLEGEERVTVRRALDEESLKRAGGYPWSAERPVLRWAPATWWVQAVQGAHASAPLRLVLTPGSDEATIALELLDKPGLGGTLRSSDGVPIPSARVYAVPFEGAEPPSTEPRDWRGVRRSALRGRYDQRTQHYVFRDIEPGQYLVCVTVGGRDVVGSAVARVEGCLVEQDIVIPALSREGHTAFRVLGPDGEPLEPRRTTFQTSYRGGSQVISGGGTALARNDGTWLVGHLPMTPKPGTDADAVYTVRITHRDLGHKMLEYDPGESGEIVVRFQKPSALTVTVSGLEDRAILSDLQLYLKGGLSKWSLGLTGTGGRRKGAVFSFAKVQPGDWLLGLYFRGTSGAGAAHTFFLIDASRVDVRPGENHIDWELPRLHTVRIEPAEKTKGVRLALKRLDVLGGYMQQFSAWDEKSGADVFRFVPAGRYEVSGNHEGKKISMEILVPQQTVIRLD